MMNSIVTDVRRALRKGMSAHSLLGAISILAAPASMAQQNAPSSGLQAETVDEVIVVGTRASLQSAIERKKKAGTVVDSVVAEDIAQFPDKNIGEALQRITGVQLQRDFGEGVAVSIRGIEPDLNRVEVNGVSLLGNGGAGQRGADFREFASELVKSIDVFKGFTADMTEGGIGGTVSIQTRRPLEMVKPLIAATASAEYLDTMDEAQPRGNVTLADKFFNDRFGVIVNATYDHVDTRGDFLRDTEWVRLADFDSATRPDKTTVDPLYESYSTFASCGTLTVAAQRTACQTQFYDYSPRIPRYGIWTRSDERMSGMATLQFRATDNLDFYVEAQVNDRKNRLIDNNYSIDLTAASRFAPNSVVTDESHNVIGLTTSLVSPNATTGAGNIFGTSRRDFAYEQRSQYYSGGFEWDLNRLRVSALGVHSTATTDSETNNIGISATIPGIQINLDQGSGVPIFTFPAGCDPQNASTYASPCGAGLLAGGASLQYRPEEIETSEDQFKLDFDWDVDLPLIHMIEFGGQYRESGSLAYRGGGYTRPDGVVVPSANITQNVTVGAANNFSNPNAQVWTSQRLIDFINAAAMQTEGTFFDSSAVNRAGLPDSWLTPDFSAVPDYFDLSGFNHNLVRSANGYAQIPAHDIEEKISATYLKANFGTTVFGKALNGNLGVRYVETRDVASGSNTIRERRPTPTGFADVTVGVQTLTLDNDYRDVLPSFNVSLEITPSVISRFGYAKVLARPRPTDLVPNANCLYDLTLAGSADADPDDCTAGNPDLKPYRADQFDLDIGWYPNPDTLLSAALFYKDVKTFVLARTLVRNVDLFHDGVLYDVQQPINGEGAKISGVELSAQTAFTFLPSPFDGFGGIVNYTYSDAKDVGLKNSLSGEELTFPGLSEHSYNVIVYYDKGPLNVRAAYNGRTDWLQAAAERSGNPVFRDGSAYLDAKIVYRFENPDLSIFVEGKNLTGETERTTSGDMRLGEYSYPGKRYFAGASIKF